MTIEIKELVSNSSVLVDLTDAESSKINGGYAPVLQFATGNNLQKTFAALGIVNGKRTSDPRVVDEQRQIGIPDDTIQAGQDIAEFAGGGVYTLPVLTAKLAG
ncbi:hypothetical protein [Chamaesiphon polymorphus]|nr:hypothetical protein [Chamaesiphon polymorphus]